MVQQAAFLEKRGAAAHALGKLGLDGVLGDAEVGRDFPVRKAVEQPEREHLAATVGELADGVGEKIEFLLAVGGISGIGPVFYDGQLGQIAYGLDRNDATAAEQIERGVARGGEEKGFCVVDAAGAFGAEEPGVGFLHEVVDVAQRREHGAQVGAQGGLVGLNVLGEPAGVL